jgi:hypothetical protein
MAHVPNSAPRKYGGIKPALLTIFCVIANDGRERGDPMKSSRETKGVVAISYFLW